jgi:ABC-type branched-subunit amino acid transport system substrate-binding protein
MDFLVGTRRAHVSKVSRPIRSSFGAVGTVWALAGLTALAAALPAFGAEQPRSSKPGLVVAVFSAFTGTDAAFGPSSLAGCISGAHEVNASGGVFGHQITCMPVDDKSDPADAVSVVTKMLTSNSNLTVVLGPPGNSAPTVSPIISASKIPMFSETGTPLMDKNKDRFFYRITPSDSVTGIAMAYWAYKHGCKTAAAVFDTNSSAATVVPAMKAEYLKLGGRLVQNLLVAADAPSYRSEAAQFVKSNSQCAFTETDPQTAATFWSEVLQQAHTLPPIFGDQADLFGPYYQAVIPVTGKAFNFTGLTQSAPVASTSFSLYTKYLKSASSQVSNPEQYSNVPPSMSDADAVIMAALAMVDAKSTSGSKFQRYVTDVTGFPRKGRSVVHTFAEGLAALRAHKKIVYVGIGGAMVFNKYHNAAAQFSALKLNNKTKATFNLGSIPLSALP